MKLKSEIVGGVLTGLYLMLIAALVYCKWDTVPDLKLSDFGDFLAGVFGPVAFLWLVLGYLQQGRELRISSEALQMQAKELRESVEQQAALVIAQNSQNAHNKLLTEPIIRLIWEGLSNDGFIDIERFHMTNSGHSCMDIEIMLLGGGMHEIYKSYDTFDKGETIYFNIPTDLFPSGVTRELYVHYKKLDGQHRTQFFGLRLVDVPDGAIMKVSRFDSSDRRFDC